jgi:signal transduction histidine kinase
VETRTVLIIDNEADRAVLRRYLEQDITCRYRFIEASLVAAGVERVRTDKPDCAFLDYRLPDGNALDFLGAIKDADGHVPLPVVILSDDASLEVAIALLKEGAQDYLVKANLQAGALHLSVNTAIYKMEARREVERLLAEAQAQNAALLTARAHAERAGAVKDQFLAMVSHELRTSLTPVLSLVSSSLGEPDLAPDLRESLTLIRRNIQLEARLIDDLLDLTRVLGGEFDVQKTPVDLHACIQAALDLCQSDFDVRKIALHTGLRAAPRMVSADFSRLQQVFWNLLRTAAQFTPSGGRITLSTSNQAGFIVVTVGDIGAGASAARLAEISNAFHYCDTTPSSGHLSLGFSVGRSVIEAHGGTLSMNENGPDRGVTFTVRLAQLITAAESADHPPPPVPRGTTILVVEDHEDTRRVLSRALRRKGFGVTSAVSVESACEQFTQQPADLIICDIGLPDGTGWDMLRRLRESGPVRAIAVSGHGMNHDMENSRAAGFAAHITKPVDFSQLEAIVARVLEASPLN